MTPHEAADAADRDRPAVVWVSYRKPDIIARGYWDQGLLERVLLPPLNPVHVDGFAPLHPAVTEAIVVLPAQHHATPEHVERLNFDLARLDGVVLILTGDECSLFPWQAVEHPNLRLWTMTPRADLPRPPGRLFGEGWPPACPALLDELALGGAARAVDVSFAGQVNHHRRKQCLQAAQRAGRRGVNIAIAPSDGFGQGLAYHSYLDLLLRSKIVLCPAGACTQDSFRAYEALEAGALPLVDGLRADDTGAGYWEFVYDTDPPPFPILHHWDTLPTILPTVLDHWPVLAAEAAEWWTRTKQRHVDDLAEDLAAVRHGLG